MNNEPNSSLARQFVVSPPFLASVSGPNATPNSLTNKLRTTWYGLSPSLFCEFYEQVRVC